MKRIYVLVAVVMCIGIVYFGNFKHVGAMSKSSKVTLQLIDVQDEIGKKYNRSFLVMNSRGQKISITIKEGELVNVGADVIVDAANDQLSPGATVSAALYKAANASTGITQQEWAKVKANWEKIPGRSFNVGDAIFNNHAKAMIAVDQAGNVVTAGTKGSRVMRLIHAVGPMGITPDAEQEVKDLLASAYRQSLEIADRKRFGSIVFPAISTGVFGGDKYEAGEIEVGAIVEFLETNAPTSIKEIILLVWQGYTQQDKKDFFDSYNTPLENYFGIKK